MRWLLFLGSLTLLELVVLWQVGLLVGFWPSVAIIVVTGLLGGALAKREGLRVFREWSAAMGAGQMPEVGLIDGVLVLLGGLLLLAPGFVGDVVGLLLLIPPTRRLVAAVVRGYLLRRFGSLAENGRAMQDSFADADGSEAGFGGVPFGTFTVIRGGDIFSSSGMGGMGAGDGFSVDDRGHHSYGRGVFPDDGRDIVVVDTTGETVSSEGNDGENGNGSARPILALPAAPIRDEEEKEG
jgi:UPF0716 family protein affecting phage T7 exclusion